MQPQEGTLQGESDSRNWGQGSAGKTHTDSGLLPPWESVMEPLLHHLAGFPCPCHLLSTHPRVALSLPLPSSVLEQHRK